MQVIDKSKKGVTLVELVICCVIMILLGGACTAVLVSGQKLFIAGSETANSQLEASLLQNTIMNVLPKVNEVKDSAISGTNKKVVSISFAADALTITNDSSVITVNQVAEFTFSIKKAGKMSTARTHFSYTAILDDGTNVSGGLVLPNIIYEEGVSSSLQVENKKLTDLTNKTLYFAVEANDMGN